MARPKSALLVGYGGGHVTMLAPVMQRLQAAGVQCTLLALTTGYRKAQLLGLQPVGYKDFQHCIPQLERVLAWGHALRDGNTHPDVEQLETDLYLGVNFAQWVSDWGLAEAQAHYAKVGRRGFVPRNFARAVVDFVKPSIVITTNTPRTEQACIEAALDVGIPTISMVDLFAMPGDPYFTRQRHADCITVLNQLVYDNFIAAGFAPGRILIAGNPAFDSIVAPQVLAQAQQLRERHGWQGLKVLMWAGQFQDANYAPLQWQGTRFSDHVEDYLRTWVEQHQDYALVVRYHPNEFQHFQVRAPQPRVFVGNPQTEPLHPWLHVCDTVVLENSTVGLEAAIAGRQVLTLAFSPAYQAASMAYDKLGIARAVPQLEDLGPAIVQAESNPVANASAFNAGHAAQTVAERALAMLGA